MKHTKRILAALLALVLAAGLALPAFTVEAEKVTPDMALVQEEQPDESLWLQIFGLFVVPGIYAGLSTTLLTIVSLGLLLPISPVLFGAIYIFGFLFCLFGIILA